MAVSRPLAALGKAALLAALVLPPAAVWLSGRFGEDPDREPQPAAPAPLATLPRSQAAATPSSHPSPAADAAPSAATPVTVGPGVVTVSAAVAGAPPAPIPRAGEVVGEPQGLPDPNRSEATPR